MQIGPMIITSARASELDALGLVTPEVQRVRDEGKVKDLIAHQLAHYRTYGGPWPYPPLVVVRTDETGDTKFIVDGQHRHEALRRLYADHSHDSELAMLVYSVPTLDRLEEVYAEINKNAPVPDFSPFSSNARRPAESTALRLKQRFPGIWTSSGRARRPSLNFSWAQQSLAWLSDRANISSAGALEEVVMSLNGDLEARAKTCQGDFTCLPGGPTGGMIERAEKHGLYLGLYRFTPDTDYGYTWAAVIAEKLTGEKILRRTGRRKKKGVPKAVRLQSWSLHVGETVGKTKCICCRDTEITMGDFEAGHVVAEAEGGAAVVDNVLPVCGLCNRSMGTCSMHDYVRDHYPKNLSLFEKREYEGGRRGSWLGSLVGVG